MELEEFEANPPFWVFIRPLIPDTNLSKGLADFGLGGLEELFAKMVVFSVREMFEGKIVIGGGLFSPCEGKLFRMHPQRVLRIIKSSVG